MIKIVFSLVVCLAGSLAISAAAEPLSTREILHLNKFGPGISNVSWCTDDTLTFVSRSPQDDGQPATRGRALNMFSLIDGTSRPLLVYPNAAFHAHCARGGEFVSVSGTDWIANRLGGSTSVARDVTQRFTHLVEVLHEQRGQRRQLTARDHASLGGPLLTDMNGNVFGRVNGVLIERKHINMAALTERQQQEISFKVTRDFFEFSVLSFEDNPPASNFPRVAEFVAASDTRPRYPPKFNVYGLNADPFRSVGLIQCPAPRPGCVVDSPEKTVVIYTSSSYATSNVVGPDGRYPGHPALYTVVPDHNPRPQRWPIVKAYATKHPYELVVRDVAIDAKRCLVLLEPNREAISSRVAGRLRQDLFIADCQVREGKLEYSEPHKIGRKQGSFIWPRLGIHGDTVVMTEAYDVSSVEEDQIPLEKAELGKARVCARLFSGNSAASLRRINSICVLASQMGQLSDPLIISSVPSPSAKFIAFPTRSDPVIVGRDFRQDGRGPAWLTNEE